VLFNGRAVIRARETGIRPVLRGAALALAIAAFAAGCGGGDSNTTTTTVQTTETAPSPTDAAIARSFDKYIAALNKHDGLAVCELLAVSSFDKLHPPAQRESCAEGITDSIGHPGPTGLMWRSAHIVGERRVQRGERTAKLFVTVKNSYKNGPAQSEEETVSMKFESKGWRLAEPDTTLLRAIGQA
jgi:hypothetical protein